jgi:hypothetical protein
MDTRQTLLVLGAVVIFSITALFTNREMLETGMTITETQVISGASVIGLSCIENVKLYDFDEALVLDPDIEDTAQFTPVVSLGPDAGETISNYDDIDDFNGLIDTVNTQLVTYYVNTAVVYVDSTNLTVPVAYRTYYKELNVFVFSPFMEDTLKMKHVFCHWK